VTGKERLTAAYLGLTVDRPPIWLREGFEIHKPIPPAEDFREGWRNQELYRELRAEVAPYIDLVEGWGVGPHLNRFLMIPASAIVSEGTGVTGNTMYSAGRIETPSRSLRFRRVWKHHNNNGWLVEHPVTSFEDLERVAEVPFALDADDIRRRASSYYDASEDVGDRGVARLGISSPIVVISGLMDLQLFLELSYIHRDYFCQLADEITDRTLAVLDVVFEHLTTEEHRSVPDTTANLGGSEQCTPPMMAPEAFDDFVVPYDGRIVARLKELDIPVNMHCHGKVRHALGRMIEMGVDATDPVEPPPAGDVTYAEARKISGDELTLVGNLEWDELTSAEPEDIRERVRKILAHGSRRLVLSASAGPNTYISERTAVNYRALVEEAVGSVSSVAGR
jgi:hypothetical protein